jgi:spore maturation protein CgeB
MKKILIIGPEFYDYNLSIQRAFNNLGFNTLVAGYFADEVTSFRERISYHIAMDKKEFFNRKKQLFNDEIIRQYNYFKPDVVFVVHGGILIADTLIKMKNCRKVFWLMDSITRSSVAAFIELFDFIFFFEKTDVDWLLENKNIKSLFLPLALDPEAYYPFESEKDIDILFVGALYDERINLLTKIIKEFKDRQIKIYGNYYSPLRKPIYHIFRNDKNVFLNKNILPSKVNELYNKSKVCLNIHHSQSKFGVNQRFFEISGSRSFQLVDRKGYILENFTTDEIMTYSGEADMMEKISFALNNFSLVNETAGNAYKKVISEHTFTDRVKYVLDVVNA